jgi:Na+-driven multidrug efflux pump
VSRTKVYVVVAATTAPAIFVSLHEVSCRNSISPFLSSLDVQVFIQTGSGQRIRMLDRWFAWNALSPACRWLLAAVTGVLTAQHTSLVMNIVRLTAYSAIGLLVARLLLLGLPQR